jgi:hypothetical protein
LFSLHGESFRLCDENGATITILEKLSGKTIYVCKPDDQRPKSVQKNGPSVKYINVTGKGGKSTVFLENPTGTPAFESEQSARQFAESLL